MVYTWKSIHESFENGFAFLWKQKLKNGYLGWGFGIFEGKTKRRENPKNETGCSLLIR